MPTGLMVKPTQETADHAALRAICFLVNCLKGLGKKDSFCLESGASQVSLGVSVEKFLRRLGIREPKSS